MLIYVMCSMLLSVFSLQAEFLELPRSFETKAIYHKKAYQLDEFSCGYNVLFNACNLERTCNLANRFSEYALFKKTCTSYILKNKLKPKDAVYNNQLSLLAEDYLGMQQLCVLGFEGNQICPLFTTPTQITYFWSISQQEKEHRLKQAMIARGQELLASIKDRLDNDHSRYTMVHFVCNLRLAESKHWILITLVQNRTGRALYIFDNANRKIEESSQSKRYIDFLVEQFGISPKKQFRGPQLPDIWRTIPKRSPRIQQDDFY